MIVFTLTDDFKSEIIVDGLLEALIRRKAEENGTTVGEEQMKFLRFFFENAKAGDVKDFSKESTESTVANNATVAESEAQNG